eukprot:3108394-Pyramimonas_sp.AAC.1
MLVPHVPTTSLGTTTCAPNLLTIPDDAILPGLMLKSAPMMVGRPTCSTTVQMHARSSTLASESPSTVR